MRQLWQERERFMKYDRGWYLDDNEGPSDEGIDMELTENLQDLDLQEKKKKDSRQASPDRAPQKETDNEDIQRRLDAVESFYVSPAFLLPPPNYQFTMAYGTEQTQALVHLQSITIVFLKVILTNVSAVVNQANGPNNQSMRYVSHNAPGSHSVV